MLEIAEYDHGSTAYNESISFELKGKINIENFCYAVNTVISRHDSLRSYISSDKLKQIVNPTMEIKVALLDLSQGDTDKALQTWFLAESKKPFNLYNGPLIRVSLVKIAIEQYILNICTHHIISDGWSLVVILKEICQLYSQSPEVPKIQQFSNYLQWYDEESKKDIFKASKKFWQEKINNTSPISLPFDYTIQEQKTYKGSRISTKIKPDLVLSLKKSAMECNSTLFHFLLTAYSFQLKNFCKQQNFTIGISVTGRSGHLAEHLIGYCSHIIPVFIDIDEDISWKNQVQQVKNSLIQSLKHQNVPLVCVVNELPQSQRKNIIQATFNLDLDMRLSGLKDIQTKIISQPVTSVRYPLSLNIIPEVDKLHLDLDYNVDLFRPESIQLFLDNFIEFIAQFKK